MHTAYGILSISTEICHLIPELFTGITFCHAVSQIPSPDLSVFFHILKYAYTFDHFG